MRIVSRSSAAALVAALIVAVPASLAAQAGGQPPQPPKKPLNAFDPTGLPDTSMFAPLPMPRGTEYRTGSGAPGPRYWEQKADYDLRGTLDTATKTLRGEMTSANEQLARHARYVFLTPAERVRQVMNSSSSPPIHASARGTSGRRRH